MMQQVLKRGTADKIAQRGIIGEIWNSTSSSMIRNSISFHSQERLSCRLISRIAAARGSSVAGDGDTLPDGGEVSRPEKTSTMSDRLGAQFFDISGKKLPLIEVMEKALDRDSR